MGRIKRFNLNSLIERNNATCFLETGTWKGDGLAYAAAYNFEKLYSSEIIQSIAEAAAKRFAKDSRIKIFVGASTNVLKEVTSTINGNCIFWLDAHFPGAEEGLNDYNEVEEENIKLPLQKELEIIAGRKRNFQDIILIDDLRIYEEGNYESGNLPDNVIPPLERNINFVNRIFGDTHEVLKFYRDEGYLALLPKKALQMSLIKKMYYAAYNTLFRKLL